jgi:hypothetical protein
VKHPAAIFIVLIFLESVPAYPQRFPTPLSRIHV